LVIKLYDLSPFLLSFSIFLFFLCSLARITSVLNFPKWIFVEMGNVPENVVTNELYIKL
jgi:hypothetical protein